MLVEDALGVPALVEAVPLIERVWPQANLDEVQHLVTM